MKLFLILTLSFSLSSFVNATAQKVTVDAKNATFKTVIQAVQIQTGYSFIIRNEFFVKAQPVTLKVAEKNLMDVLPLLFENQPFGYVVKGKVVSAVALPAKKNVEKITERFMIDTIRGRIIYENGEPVAGATVMVKGTRNAIATTDDGVFVLNAVDEFATLLISGVNIEGYEFKLNGQTDIGTIKARLKVDRSDEIVLNTGYQQIPKERAIGSFEVIDNKLLNRSVSTNFQDRLRGITTGMLFSNSATVGRIETDPNNRNTGITIRGESTYMSSTEPLIVVDNFPFEGELSNINPNDIDNITILKDASAASIWGARSGNGVIVITTKKGKKSEKMNVDFVSNVTIASKPDLFYSQRFLDPKDFIEVEQFLFDKGFFNSDINNKTTRPVVSPSVEIMALVRAGVISESEGQNRLADLAQNDIRDDMSKYVYQNAVNQQYSLGINGGGDKFTYRFSGGIDKNRTELIRNNFSRVTVNSQNTYNPIKNLQIIAGLNYSQSRTSLNNEIPAFTINSSKYLGAIFPYSRLKDDEGNNLDLLNRLRENYLAEAEEKGYLDWRYRPLDELYLTDNTTKVNNILARLSAQYQVIPQLSVQLNYQNEQQRITGRNHRRQETYEVRDLINKFSVFDAASGTITYNYPMGGILNTNNADWTSNTLRGQLNYDQEFGKHAIYAIVGSEIRELKTDGLSQTFIGYDDQFGTSVSNLNFEASYPTSPSGSAMLPGIGGVLTGITNRFISYYANASYSYDDKYLFSLSGRRDGANLFGVKTNDRFTPLWSVGAGWKISKESFYQLDWLPYLQLRATYGFNGNTYARGTALLTGGYLSSSITGAQTLVDITAPNPELRWERVRNINLGIDFESKGRIISGSIEYYIKNGIDLIQPTDLAPQTGFASYTANTAETKTNGLDITINARILDREFKWYSTLLLSHIKDKVIKYDAPYTSISRKGGIIGKPLQALFAFKWAGLNPDNGNPVGYIDGKESEDYAALYNNLEPDQLVYGGSAIPTLFGAFRQDLGYKGFNLSFNIVYSLNYFFRRTSSSTNYTGQLTSERHADYNKRWQNPGDEIITDVPSLVYPNNNNRSNFYRYSEVLITPADHIRLQDIRLSYDFSNLILKEQNIKRLQAFVYANNLGIIWRKNDFNIDPIASNYPVPFSFSAGININL